MGLTNFPNGISSQGVPVSAGGRMTTGSVFFVDSNTGSNGNKGTSSDKPFADIDYAVGRCTANKGDIIYVMPGHVEDLADTSTSGAIDLDVAGISVIGIGSGSLQPRIDFNHADSDFFIGADNVTVENMHFEATVTGVKIGVNIEDGVDYATVRNCRFTAETVGTDEFLVSIQTNDASNYATIEGCTIIMDAAGAVAAIGFVKDTLGTIVRNCYIQGDFSTACIEGITTKSDNLLIDSNIIINGDPLGGLNTEPCIELLTGTSGIIKDNYCACDVATFILMIIGDECIYMGNMLTDDTSSAGVAAQTSASMTVSADG